MILFLGTFKKLNAFLSQKRIFLLIFILFSFVLFLISARNVFTGSIAFWYDPARDLFLALSNLKKPTLIGPPSGIPGIFYGPYWIWFLSIPLIFTKDPRYVSFFVLTVPYFLIFSYILFNLRDKFGKLGVISLIILFFLSFDSYAIQIWNPNLAPLLTFLLFYVLIYRNFKFKFFVVGILAGLLMNFHISFGLVVVLGIFLYLFLTFASNLKKFISPFIQYSIGVIAAFLPFFVFESKHGFNQIAVLAKTLSSHSAVVGVTGMSRSEIIDAFFGSFSKLIHVPFWVGIAILIVGSLIYVSNIYKTKKIGDQEKNLLLLLLSITASLFAVYLSSKNPVWPYHFIAVEIIFVFLLGLFLKRISAIRYLLFLWALFFFFVSVFSWIQSFKTNPYLVSSLVTKEHVVKTILNDTNSKVTYYAYNPAIYTYDYDYLFGWLGKGRVVEDKNASVVYLIIPKSPKAVMDDFVGSITPGKSYRTTKEWKIEDGTIIIKREKVS